MKTLLLCLLFFLHLSISLAQTLTPEQLQTDFNRFRTAIGEAHPGQYWYTPRPVWDSLFAATGARLNRPMTQHEFYVTMLPLLVRLHDGHIKWIVAGQDEHYPFFTDSLFPLKLYFVDNRAWVVAAYGSGQVPAGAEVVSINGKPLAAILQTLLPNMTFADGDRPGGKYEDLNSFFPGYYATLVEAPDSFRVTYRTSGREQTTTLPAVNVKAIQAYAQSQKKTQKPFRLTLQEQTAVMTIERFWADKNDPDYADFLKESFREIKQKGVKSLVLDLRNNEGGEEVLGVDLYRYVTDKPFRYYDHIGIRQKKAFSFPAWVSPLYRKFRWLVVKKRGDGYVFTRQKGLKRQKPASDAFTGDVYVLVNGNTFSTATEFSARLHADRSKRPGKTVFIGQETGGGYRRNSSGIFAITQLPNSRIDLGIGLFGFEMAHVPADVRPGQGIVPDYPVTPTIEDVLNHRDRALEKALELSRTASPKALTRN